MEGLENGWEGVGMEGEGWKGEGMEGLEKGWAHGREKGCMEKDGKEKGWREKEWKGEGEEDHVKCASD